MVLWGYWLHELDESIWQRLAEALRRGCRPGCPCDAAAGAFGLGGNADGRIAPRLAGQRCRTAPLSGLAFAPEIPRRHVYRYVPAGRGRRATNRRDFPRAFLVDGGAGGRMPVVR